MADGEVFRSDHVTVRISADGPLGEVVTSVGLVGTDQLTMEGLNAAYRRLGQVGGEILIAQRLILDMIKAGRSA